MAGSLAGVGVRRKIAAVAVGTVAFVAVVLPASNAGGATPKRHSHSIDNAVPLAGPASVSPCDQTDLQNLINGGGTIGFSTDCHLNLTSTLMVPAGDTVTIDGTGHTVILDGLNLQTSTKLQVLNVQGNLNLDNLTVTNGYALGDDGTNGTDGQTGGVDGVGVGIPGGDGTLGISGQPGQGGGLYIHLGASASVTNVTFSADGAAGGVGGNGGNGGYGSSANDAIFPPQIGSGGTGGNGADAGNGAVGQGGAIYNAGSLIIKNSTFESDVAAGGTGGNGGGGGGGGWGIGTGQTGGHGGDAGKDGSGGNAQGGAIYSTGTLNVQNSSFSQNGAAAGLGGGGNSDWGVYNFGGGGGYGLYSLPPYNANGGNGGNGGKGGNGGSAAGGAIWSSKNKATLSGVTFSGDTVAAGLTAGDCANTIVGAGCGGAAGALGPTVGATPGQPGMVGMNGNSGTAVNPDVYSASSKALTIKTKSLSKATIDQVYQKTLSASGGSAPYSWTVLGLPAGMGSSSDGVIGGTPTVVGTFSVTVTVTDPTDPSPTLVSGVLSLTVKGIKPKVTLQPQSTTTSPGATVSFSSAASGDPTPTVQWEVSVSRGSYVPIPDATTTTLVLNNVTASESGNKYKALFTNAAGSKASKAVTLKVVVPKAVFSSAESATATTGQTFTFTVMASGAPTVSEKGKLPTGLSFSAPTSGTAVISGTPGTGTAGTYNLILTAANAGGKVTQSFILTVN